MLLLNSYGMPDLARRESKQTTGLKFDSRRCLYPSRTQ